MTNINVTIIGKPNVGKSSIFNSLIGQKISEVGSIPGTTVESISYVLQYNDIKINFIDTGGLKRKSKSHFSIQKIITKDSLRNLKIADIVLFIIDMQDPITKNDKQLFRLVVNKLKNIIVVVNKSDLFKSDFKNKQKYFTDFFYFYFPNIIIKPIFYSSLFNSKKKDLLEGIYNVYKQNNFSFSNKEANNVLRELLQKAHPPLYKGIRPSIKFIKQVNSVPLIFKAFGSRLSHLSKDYKNYLIKNIMEKLKIYSRVVVIKYINNKNPFAN